MMACSLGDFNGRSIGRSLANTVVRHEALTGVQVHELPGESTV
jgi:hypothetical protein